jgi:hypothetical protein
MSMALRSNKRTKTTQPVDGEIVAAAEINLRDRDDQKYLQATVAHSRRTGANAWRWFDEIGEVHNAISRSARIAGYAQLRCVEVNEAGRITSEVTDGLAADIVSQIQSPYGGVRDLMDRFYVLQKVPADAYLLEVLDGDGDLEGYHFASPDELDVSSFSSWKPGRGRVRWITVPSTPGSDQKRFVREIEPEQLLGRVWTPSRRYVDLTDSALAALDTECEALYLLTKTIKAKLMSRFATAGILFLPNGISTARVRKGQNQLAGQSIDDTLNFLVAAMTRNMKSWEEASAWLPIMLRGNADEGEKIRHIVMDHEVFGTDLELRRELIERIFQGLDQNQDSTQGNKDQSHWGMWASSDDERRIAVQPDLERACWALTRLVLHRRLADDGMVPEEILKYKVWYDLSAASVRANQQEDARQARDRGLISAVATRRMSGIEEEDAIDPEEYIRWVGTQTHNPVLMLHGLPEADNIDWDKAMLFPSRRGPAAASPADKAESGPGEGDPGSPDDQDRDTPRSQRPA